MLSVMRSVTPASTPDLIRGPGGVWIPAFAGMTETD